MASTASRLTLFVVMIADMRLSYCGPAANIVAR